MVVFFLLGFRRFVGFCCALGFVSLESSLKKRLSTLLLFSSLSGYSVWAVAGLALSTLAVIGAAALGVGAVLLASPGLLTVAVFAGGAGLLCATTTFCAPDPVTGAPSAASAPAPVLSVPDPKDPTMSRTFSEACMYAQAHGAVACHVEVDSNGGPILTCVGGPCTGGQREVSNTRYCNVMKGFYVGSGNPRTGDLTCAPDEDFSNDAADGVKVSDGSPTASSLNLPSFSTLPPDAFEIWPGSGLYGSPSGPIIYDMRDGRGNSTGVAETATTVNPDNSKKMVIDIVGGTMGDKQVIDIAPTGERTVTVTKTVNVTNAQGVPDTLRTAVVTEYDSSGTKLAPSTFTSSTTDSGATTDNSLSVAPSDGGNGSPISVGAVGSGGAGSGGSGTGLGSCTSGDCATESTQLANKGLLQSIKDFFTGSGTAPNDPQARTGSDINTGLSTYSNALQSLKGWQLPAHTSQCPSGTFTIPLSDHVFSFDGHCTFASNNATALSGIFLVLWNLAAMWIVLRV